MEEGFFCYVQRCRVCTVQPRRDLHGSPGYLGGQGSCCPLYSVSNGNLPSEATFAIHAANELGDRGGEAPPSPVSPLFHAPHVEFNEKRNAMGTGPSGRENVESGLLEMAWVLCTCGKIALMS